ncbi:MAG: Na+/H+ antiporter NhaC family protein [bacterium]|nr:Na+/H+ antiporter NhaC family protein [bacterium]
MSKLRSWTAIHPLLRAGAGLLLAALLAYLLPANRSSVLRQQVIQHVPQLAEQLGNGPWRFAGPLHSACESGFLEAQQRRTAPTGDDPPILFACTEKNGNILFSATVQHGESTATQEATLRPIVGWSLFPPLAAILVAVFSGRLILALVLAVLSGGFLAAPAALSAPAIVLESFRRAALDYVWTPLESSFQLYILGFTAALIGMVRVTSLSGGNLGIANLLAARAGGARSTRLAAFFMGLAIFFDDYANTIVVGTTLRPIADRFRVSREKLAYLVDSTAAPIAGVAIISTWIGYEVGLFGDLMRDLHTGISGYQLFFSILPVRFYCLFTLFFVLSSTWFRKDFGPMLRAEQRAQQTGQVLRPGATPLVGRKNEDIAPAEGVQPAWWTAAVPVMFVVTGVILGMALDTLDHPDVKSVRLSDSIFSVAYWTACFSSADNARVLFLSAILGSVLAILFAVTRRRIDTGKPAIGLYDALSAWVHGITGVWYAIAILILAWAIKEACTDVGTPTYLTAALSPLLSPAFLPVLIFGLASLVAFSIGTSWTTMAILIPTVVPLAHAMGGMPLTVLCAAAVLDGAIFGDHCSPISDTTVMSSIASSCDHLDHVQTQLPYALTTMSAAAVFGYLGTALAYPWWVGSCLGMGAILAVLFTLGRNPDASPETRAI